MELTASLRAVPLLAKVGDKDLKALSLILRTRTFRAGENIITEGEDGDEMFILTAGSVDVLRRTVFGDTFVVATLDAKMHSVFGEMAMIDHDKRSSTVRAREDCTTLSIDRASFDRFCTDHPQSGVELFRLLSINLAQKIRKENDNLQLVYQALIEEIEAG